MKRVFLGIFLMAFLSPPFSDALECSSACNYCSATYQGNTWCGFQDTVGVKYTDCSSTGSQRLLCAADHNFYSCSLQYTWPSAIKANNCQKVGSYYCDETNDVWTTTNPCPGAQKIEFFGYYSGYGSFSDCTQPDELCSFSDITFATYSQNWSKDYFEDAINETYKRGFKIILRTDYFQHNFNKTESEWRSYLTELKYKLNASSQKIFAFYVFDEPEQNFLNPNDAQKVGLALSLTKEFLPDIKTYITFFDPWSAGSFLINDPNLDLIGLNPYFYSPYYVNATSQPYECNSENKKWFEKKVQPSIYWVKSGGHLITEVYPCWPDGCTPNELAQINSVLNSDTNKNIVLTPPSAKCNEAACSWCLDQMPSICQQEWYYNLAKSDPDIMGLFWYLYSSTADLASYNTRTSQGVPDCLGVGLHVPDVLAQHKIWGKEILCANQEYQPFCANNSVSYRNSEQAKCYNKKTTYPGGLGNNVCDSACGSSQQCHGYALGTNNCNATCNASSPLNYRKGIVYEQGGDYQITDASDNASCSSPDMCVHDGTCYAFHTCSDADHDGDVEYCISRNRWAEIDSVGRGLDYYPIGYNAICEFCVASQNSWNIGGDAVSQKNDTFGWNHCCGDDANEYKIERVCDSSSYCTTNSNDVACCDANNKCVYNGVCYAHNWVGSAPWNIALTVKCSVGTWVNQSITFIGDLNNDGKIDINDLVLISQKFGKNITDTGWDPNVDLVNDGEINIFDIIYVASRFT